MKKNFTLIIAFALPVAFVVAVALLTYLPARLVSTDYDFLYATCDNMNRYYDYHACDSYLKQKYIVVDNQLVENVDVEMDVPDGLRKTGISNYNSRIFLHETAKNESREITLAEAQNFVLSSLLTSPDGVTISNFYERNVGVFPLFDSSSFFGYYLTVGDHKKKLNLINSSDRYYQDNFHFIGWILSN